MQNDVTVAIDRQWFDLSLAQQAVWLDAKLSGPSAYQLGSWARIAGTLDKSVVRQAISLIMARHDGLRLRVDDELPRQWLDESVEPPLNIVDLPAGTPDPDAAFQALIDDRFSQALPLGDHSLFSVELIRAGENLNFMLWRFHHLVADSASVSITISHWFNAYQALTSGTSTELTPDSSYLRTLSADAAYLESASYQKDLAYWTDRFNPIPPSLIADLEFRDDRIAKVPSAQWTMADDEFGEFQAAAKAAGVNVQRALFALFAMVLGRRHGQTDVVSGIALHRRDLANRHTVGMLAGVIPGRCQFDLFWTLSECIQAYSESMDRDLRHQRLPVDILSRSLGLAGTGRARLFEVGMSYIPSSRGWNDSAIEGLPIVTGAVATKEASPISLQATEHSSGDGLTVTIAVNTDFLESSEAHTLLTLLQNACHQFVQEPETRFENLPTVTPAEHDLVVNQWNNTDCHFEAGTLDTLFTAQARRTPGALAVIGRDGQPLTYAELDEQSTRLARALVYHGVKPERVVGVRMQRSSESIVAFLAILKAGGVYLPLDPSYPAERLEYIAYDAGALLVLESIDALTGDADLPSLTDARRLAYVIYTSGTTGLPKGVEVPHTAAVNLAFARCASHDPLGVGDRVLAGISVGFDVSIGQLLLPLLSGATVVIAGDLKSMGSDEFWSLIATQRVSHINSVPSFLDSILDTAPAAATLTLKRLMLGGEALSGALVSRIQTKLPGVEVVNMYGPTEACIDATFHIAAPEDLQSAVLPIGKPLLNYRAYVLDPMLEPVGVGVSGELYLGGAGLARGYVNAADLTSERFVADPFSQIADRLYRTGDRARWRADGSLEFLGRVDQQVKIRGFRVEPGEVAATLLNHPAVAQAVVVARRQNLGDSLRLVAYLVPRDDGTLRQTADLRAFLSERLPDYMVPAAFVFINSIPLNRNGKLDERALPSPGLNEGEFIAPRTPTEETVAKLFAAVLGLKKCGLTDHFFELGGHSLLATSLVSQLRALGIKLPLAAVFESPTVEALSRRIDASLPTSKTNLLITAGVRPEQIPLSYPQERIWFVDQLQQNSCFNIPVALELRGLLDVDALQRALERIVFRHESLRTRLVLRGARPSQEITPPPSLNLPRVNIAESALPRYLAEFGAHRFDLSASLPFEMRLLALESERHILAAVIHHVAFDGWSAAIFFHEFSVLYSAFSQKQPDPLPAPIFQYPDFAIWQRQQERDADLTFWLETLKGAPPQSALPADSVGHVDQLVQSISFVLAAEIHSALLRIARDSGASLFMLIHAASALLLSRWSGQNDVVIGTVVANRNRLELEAVMGCFINTLALRTTFKPGESFSSLLARVKDADLAALSHQDLPFEQLVEALQPERSLQHTPIFQVLLVLQNAPAPVGNFTGLVVTPVPFEVQAPQFDLTLTLTEQNDGLSVAFVFATSRFHPTTIQRFGKQFQRTLEAIAQNPDQEASRIDILEPAERHVLLNEWSGTVGPLPQTTLDALFTEQALAHPFAIAVVGTDGSPLTYAELDADSSRVARYLVAKGVGPGCVVGVRMQRSAETVIAFLAILKAGGVYLPLDPSYPVDRLEFMIANSGALLVLDSIPAEDIAQDLPTQSDSSRLAYIIYTSGTTGRPKGVAVAHSAPVNLAQARRACHDPIGPGDRILAAISVGFDVSIGQLLLPLLSGATVVIAADLKTMSSSDFWSFLAQRRVTHVNSVPSFFDSILDYAPRPTTLSLKRLMLGGEALSGALVSRIHQLLPDVEVVNMYGPTEACIDATYHVATQADFSAPVLPIGRPLSNYRTYVLDNCLEPSGIGVAGELYLGGAGLAHGYVNDPDLTAERFIKDPFASDSAGKLYRTGDLARWRKDGCLEFLGRVDQQVKIRGFRVEPAEIEAQLRKQPDIRDVVVLPHNAAGGTRLVAFFCAERTIEAETLRKDMSLELPDYMIPTAFIQLDKLPLTANGKLDRKALPDLDKTVSTAREFAPPSGEVEQKMAKLWAELLKLERIGRHDNFFELGGHSLLAMTLIERLQQQGLAIDVRALFTTPTIASLAAASATTSLQSAAPKNRILPGTQKITPEMLALVDLSQSQLDKIVATVPGGAANIQDIYLLSPLQEGILFQNLLSTQGDPYLAPFLLAFDQRERLSNFIQAFQTIINRHDVLRTAMFFKDVDAPVQIVLRQVSVTVEELTLYGSDIETQLLKRFDAASYRLDLTKAPLLRAFMAHDPVQDRWLLLMLTHHLVLDHTSMAIVVGELRALMIDQQASLPTPVPYRNFIAQTVQGGSLAEHEAFFRSLVGDVDEPTAPFGLTETQSSAAETTEATLRLEPQFSQRLRETARHFGITPASLFHVAWASVLGFVSGRSDVVFGTVLLGRMRSGAGADRAVGMFINTLPFRLALSNSSVQKGVLAAHALLAELITHEHAPLAIAQRASAVPAPAPLFSSLLNYRYSPEEGDDTPWPGVQMISSSERTNYPVAMAVDDSGSNFTLRALVHPTAGADRINQYLYQAVSNMLDILERAPETPLHALSVIAPHERQLVLEDWNRTDARFEHGTLDALFTQQARQNPSAIAILAQDGINLTYADLDAQSTRLARQLFANGVKPETVVGVKLGRSAETVVAALAILKAGGVYLPLDPAYPPERLDYMAKDAGALLILDSIHSLNGDSDLPSLTDPNRLAYIIYTSGTTGKPKGVAVPHLAPVNVAFARRACHDPLGIGDHVLAATSVGFDVSIGQLLLPLLSGATVVIAGDLTNMGAAEFWSFLSDHGVTHINSVPSFFDSILDAAPPAHTLSLKRLMLGGEPLTGTLLGRIRHALPDTEVVNMYGPTETCIDATFHIATAEQSTSVMPIGRPLSNYRAYILNSHLQPAGIGIPGELYIAGMGLARGYVNAPELTADRFLADPFSQLHGARMYRTGDRAQWQPDGAIEFLGRVDNQIKIRGHRVELGEIEACLLQHPSIARAAMIADKEPSGNTRILAYLVTHAGSPEPSSQQLYDHLAASLPEYMIPSAFCLLPTLPITSNGKLNIKALPQITSQRLDSVTFEGPRSATETALQQIWQQLLNIQSIGIHDNFFSLGGHSLAAMRLINSCNTQFGVNLPLRILFDCPTIARLAAAIHTDSARSELHPCLVTLRQGGNKQPLFCVHPAGGLVLSYTALANAFEPDQPLYGIQARGIVSDQTPATSVEEMAADYIQAISSVQPVGPYQILGYSSGGILAYEMAQQLHQAGKKVSLLCLLDTSLPETRRETYTAEQLMHLFARNIDLDDLIGEHDVPAHSADLLFRAQSLGRLPGIQTEQFERFHACFTTSVLLYPTYRVQPWSGPFALFRATKRYGDSDDLPPDWSSFVSPNAITIDFPCSHEDFGREEFAPALARELERLIAETTARITAIHQSHPIQLLITTS